MARATCSPASPPSSASTSGTGRRPERTSCGSCVTGGSSSRRSACASSAISRDSPWSHAAWRAVARGRRAAALGLERGGDARLRRRHDDLGARGRVPPERVPRRRGRYGPRGMGVRELASCRTWTRSSPPRARSSGRRLRALPRRGACSSTWPTAAHLGSSFGARGQPGHGGRLAGRPPAGRLQPLAARRPARARTGAVARRVRVPAGVAERVNPAGWPLGLVFWPLEQLLGPVLAWNLLGLALYVVAGGLTALWLRALGVSRGAAIVGGLDLRDRAVPGRAEHGAPARADLRRCCRRRCSRGSGGATCWRGRSRSPRSRSRASSTSRSAPCRSSSPTRSCERTVGDGRPVPRPDRRPRVGPVAPRSRRSQPGSRPAGDDRRLGLRGRPLARRGRPLVGGAARPALAEPSAATSSSSPTRLADAAARARRARAARALAAARASRPCSGWARSCRSCSRSARTRRCTSRSGTRCRRSASRASPERLLPIACLRLAALAAVAVTRAQRGQVSAPGAGPCPFVAAALVLADLAVFPYAPSAADPGEPRLRGARRAAAGPDPRAAGLPAGDPLRQRLPVLRAADSARAAERLLDGRRPRRRPDGDGGCGRSTAGTGATASRPCSGGSASPPSSSTPACSRRIALCRRRARSRSGSSRATAGDRSFATASVTLWVRGRSRIGAPPRAAALSCGGRACLGAPERRLAARPGIGRDGWRDGRRSVVGR